MLMSERRWYGWGWCGAYFGQEPPRTEDGAADADEDGDGLLESEGDGDGRGPRDRPAVQVTSTAWLADGAAEGPRFMFVTAFQAINRESPSSVFGRATGSSASEAGTASRRRHSVRASE